MKNILCKISSVFVNLIEGTIAILAVATIYSFIFEANNKDHDVGLGIFVFLIWMLILIIPNLFFKFGSKFCIKEVVFFQLVPFISGAALFTIYQLVLR